MVVTTSSELPNNILWAGVYQKLILHAIPDSRFNYDFLQFTPDFRGSVDAVTRIAELPCYQNAKTLLVTSDNSLEGLRYRALKDGKRLLVGTYRLRRGFVVVDPKSIEGSKFEFAASLDGMEKPGMGRAVSLGQLRDDGFKIDMCAMGGLVFNKQGVVLWEGQALFEVQWALLQDLKLLDAKAPVVAVVHECQVVDEAQHSLDTTMPGKIGEVQCDFVVTPERVLKVQNALKHNAGVDFKNVDPDALNNIPPLQELKGIRMMEQIMSKGGFEIKEEKDKELKTLSAEEQMGIDIVDRLMKGLKS